VPNASRFPRGLLYRRPQIHGRATSSGLGKSRCCDGTAFGRVSLQPDSHYCPRGQIRSNCPFARFNRIFPLSSVRNLPSRREAEYALTIMTRYPDIESAQLSQTHGSAVAPTLCGRDKSQTTTPNKMTKSRPKAWFSRLIRSLIPNLKLRSRKQPTKSRRSPTPNHCLRIDG
jgi:hypothetical protein